MNGRVYSVGFSASAITAAQDLVEILAATALGFEVTRCEFAQSSDYGDSQAEGLSLALVRATGSSGSGGSSATPNPYLHGDPATNCTAEINNTTKATTRTILIPAALNVQAGYLWVPSPTQVIRIKPGHFFCFELVGAPVDSITVSAYVEYKELF